jgi:hypothetical protein
MEARVRKPVEIPHVVVMQMREDNVFDISRIDTEPTQRLHRTAQECPLPPLCYVGIESSVDDESAAASSRHPHEIVHRHRAVVRIAADEMIAAPRIAGGIADGKELVFLVGHAISQQTGGSLLSFNLVERLARVSERIDP